MSTCYLVGTPIGNLKDITLRALETLKGSDVIACEDTRVTRVLLDYYQIKKPLIAYHKFNEIEASESIFQLLESGKTVSVVTDAGMPCISDPGAVVVRNLRARGANIEVVPGATAVTSAIALAGLTETGFVFAGFLPEKAKDATVLLKKLKTSPYPLVFYVPPHDLADAFQKLQQELGNRPVTVVKEITKIFETVAEGTLASPPEMVEKGEFVVIVGLGEAEEKVPPAEKLAALIEAGMDKKLAVKAVAEEYKLPKNDVYRLIFND